MLDMGEPVRIVDLASNMIRLSGKEPDRDIAIEIVGARPGEKLHEELWGEGETVDPTLHPKIHARARGPIDAAWLEEELGELERLVEEGDTLELVVAARRHDALAAARQRSEAGRRRHASAQKLTCSRPRPGGSRRVSGEQDRADPPGASDGRAGRAARPLWSASKRALVDAEAILDGLNPEQRRAAEAVRGPVCILAGAGSGKTTTITRRIANQVATGAFALARDPGRHVHRQGRGRDARRGSRGSASRACAARTFHSAALAQLRYFARRGRLGGSSRRRRCSCGRSATRCRGRTGSGPPATSRRRSSGRRTAA